jgi:hypothetical protein
LTTKFAEVGSAEDGDADAVVRRIIITRRARYQNLFVT